MFVANAGEVGSLEEAVEIVLQRNFARLGNQLMYVN